MLPPEVVKRKTEANARKWCEKHGYTYMHKGAWDVFYQTPEQVGKTKDPNNIFDNSWYSSINWLDVFADLDS